VGTIEKVVQNFPIWPHTKIGIFLSNRRHSFSFYIFEPVLDKLEKMKPCGIRPLVAPSECRCSDRTRHHRFATHGCHRRTTSYDYKRSTPPVEPILSSSPPPPHRLGFVLALCPPSLLSGEHHHCPPSSLSEST
jgi:hypothetical protein